MTTRKDKPAIVMRDGRWRVMQRVGREAWRNGQWAGPRPAPMIKRRDWFLAAASFVDRLNGEPPA